MNDFKTTSACNPYGLLACKIVEQAILDYRALVRGHNAGVQTNFEEISRFLRSAWCDNLLSFTNVSGEWVLDMLEREGVPEKAVYRHTRMLTVDGQTKPLHTWCRELGMPGSSTRIYKLYEKHGRRYVEEQLTAIKRGRGL